MADWSKRLEIIDGPSKWDIMQSLFEYKMVSFKLEDGNELCCEIRSIADERGLDTVTPERELREHGYRTGDWFLEGELGSGADFYREHEDRFDVFYMSYCTDSRSGICHLYFDIFGQIQSQSHEMLRHKWGNRIWGSPSWQPS